MDDNVDSIDKQSLNTKPPSRRGGPRPGSGRPLGSPNVLTRTIRECIGDAFLELGGSKWLVQIAQDDPRVFVALLGRAMPPPPRERDEDDAALSRLTDEELVERMEASVKSFREEGTFSSDPVVRGFKASLAHPKTLEDLLAGSWDSESPVIHHVITAAPRVEPEVLPERIPAPSPVPVNPPLPGVKPAPSPRQSTDEQLPGQAANSHRRALADDYTSSRPGKCIIREWED